MGAAAKKKSFPLFVLPHTLTAEMTFISSGLTISSANLLMFLLCVCLNGHLRDLFRKLIIYVLKTFVDTGK